MPAASQWTHGERDEDPLEDPRAEHEEWSRRTQAGQGVILLAEFRFQETMRCGCHTGLREVVFVF